LGSSAGWWRVQRGGLRPARVLGGPLAGQALGLGDRSSMTQGHDDRPSHHSTPEISIPFKRRAILVDNDP
jgi:hypothetical protein